MGCICTKVTSSFGLLCVHVLVGGWETVTNEDIILINIFFFYFFYQPETKKLSNQNVVQIHFKIKKMEGGLFKWLYFSWGK